MGYYLRLRKDSSYMATRPNVTVMVKRDEPIERALRRFKRLCQHAGITKLVKAKRFYEKLHVAVLHHPHGIEAVDIPINRLGLCAWLNRNVCD